MALTGWSAFIVLVTIHQILPASATPELTITAAVVSLKETETRQMALPQGTITCTDQDDDATRAYWKTTSPSSLCGDCFQVWPGGTPGSFDLYFVPSFGSLNYRVQSSYLVTVGCTDDKEPEVTGTVEVRLEPNTPPDFTNPAGVFYDTAPVGATRNKKFGAEVYNVDAVDTDGDPIFYTMTEDPSTGLFDIGHANGQITFNNDPRLLCDPDVDFYVTASDDINQPVGPVTIDATFSQINERPEVPDDVTVQIPEDAAEKTTVLKLGATDADVYPELYYRLSAKPERGLEYYHLTGTGTETRIRTRKPLDYEYLDLRTVTLTVDVTDGFCDGPSQKVTVEITDVNEIPVISPDYREVTVYEGFINIDPQWNLIDPDENENHRWSLISGGGGKFEVDEDSGHVFSIRELDIDPNKESQTYNMDIRVLDKDDERAKSKLRITVLDKNDNVPEFFARTYEMAANPCTKVGKILGYVRAKDDDSEFQGNDVLVFSGSSNNMTIMSDGAIVLTKPCEPEGAADFMVAHVTDLGEYPGPLSGVPAVVNLVCGPCPSPVPSTDTTTAGTGDGSGGGTDNETDFFDANLGWLVPAILLGALLLGLLAYVIWRYCTRACARWRAAKALRQKSGQPKQAKTKPAKENKKQQKKPPTPPAPPPPECEPAFFGFWKETFPDRDQRHMPKREVKPASVNADKQVEKKERAEELEEKKKREMERKKAVEKYQKELAEYQRKVNEQNNPTAAAPAAPKKKRCIIL